VTPSSNFSIGNGGSVDEGEATAEDDGDVTGEVAPPVSTPW
jgi:hypothetical protein